MALPRESEGYLYPFPATEAARPTPSFFFLAEGDRRWKQHQTTVDRNRTDRRVMCVGGHPAYGFSAELMGHGVGYLCSLQPFIFGPAVPPLSYGRKFWEGGI